MTDWQPLLARVVKRPAVIPSEIGELRGALLQVGGIDGGELDKQLAAGWRAAVPVVRQQVLRDALEGMKTGLLLTDALLKSLADGDHVSANAAIHVLGSCESLALDDSQWRRIARVTERQRAAPLPDVQAAVLLAERGPPAAFATIALCAFRHGPEDAEDRQMALSALGRFDRDIVLPLLRSVAASGALGLEAIGGAAHWAMRHLHSMGDAERAQVVAVLVAGAGVGSPGGIHVVDGWQRWGALDVLARLVGEEALPTVAAAWLAGGEDLDDWLLPGLAQRCADICPDAAAVRSGPAAIVSWLHEKAIELPPMRPIAPLAERAMARSPRISRRAFAQLENSGAPTSRIAALKAQRAGIEQALVKRHQLMGSFLVGADTEAAPLDDAWRPVAELLDDNARERLLAEENAWLAGP